MKGNLDEFKTALVINAIENDRGNGLKISKYSKGIGVVGIVFFTISVVLLMVMLVTGDYSYAKLFFITFGVSCGALAIKSYNHYEAAHKKPDVVLFYMSMSLMLISMMFGFL